MKPIQFCVLLSSLFLIGSVIASNGGLLFLSVLWLVLAVIEFFMGER